MALALQRLAEPEVRDLVASCPASDLPEVPGQVTDYVWAGSAGIPLIAVELLEEALASGLLVHESWRVTGKLRHRISATLARTVGGRLDLIGPHGRELLSLAAVLGQRFPVALLQAASGMSSRELLSQLHGDVISQLVAPDEETPDWYSFQHSLMVDVVLSLLDAGRRSELAARAADAVEATYPGFPGEWCQTAAALRLQAKDQGGAGRLFAEAGRRAFHQGAASSAVTLLDKALGLLAADGDARVRAAATRARRGAGGGSTGTAKAWQPTGTGSRPAPPPARPSGRSRRRVPSTTSSGPSTADRAAARARRS